MFIIFSKKLFGIVTLVGKSFLFIFKTCFAFTGVPTASSFCLTFACRTYDEPSSKTARRWFLHILQLNTLRP